MKWVFALGAVVVVGLFLFLNAREVVAPSFPVSGNEPEKISILFGGDMMFDRAVRTIGEEKGGDFLFSCVEELLSEADFVVANLEGPITDNLSVSVGSIPEGEGNYTFTFPIGTAELLARHNIWLVSLGNNHIENFGREGVVQTLDYLKKSNVKFFGDPISYTSVSTKINDVPLAFISFNEFDTSVTVRESVDRTTEQIKKTKLFGLIPIVYTHWGDEYVEPPQRVREWAHAFVDAGAEIVIGSHPHVVQEHELYKEKHIYYSLGNFIFDQYWEEAVRNGLLLDVRFSKKGVSSIKEIPTYLSSDRIPCPLN